MILIKTFVIESTKNLNLNDVSKRTIMFVVGWNIGGIDCQVQYKSILKIYFTFLPIISPPELSSPKEGFIKGQFLFCLVLCHSSNLNSSRPSLSLFLFCNDRIILSTTKEIHIFRLPLHKISTCRRDEVFHETLRWRKVECRGEWFSTDNRSTCSISIIIIGLGSIVYLCSYFCHISDSVDGEVLLRTCNSTLWK